MSRISGRAVKDAVDVSRQRLGLDTVDLMQASLVVHNGGAVWHWACMPVSGYISLRASK